MAETLGSVLIAEVGSLVTRVILVDTVEGETRLIGQAEVATTAEPPYEDVFIGVLEAAVRIADTTGRVLLDNGRLLRPQNAERDGINHILVTSSAAGTLEAIIVGIARDVSARSAQHAIRSTYTNILQTVTLDDAPLDADLRRTTSWVERQVQTMLVLRPHVIMLAGGLEGGARDVLVRLARVVAFTLSHMGGGVGGQQRRDTPACAVIYAGNSEVQEQVVEVLSGQAETLVVDNLRPALELERLEAARAAVGRLYEERMLKRLPGIKALEHLSSKPVTTVCASEGIMTRFLAERYGRRVLTLDVGSTSSSALFASPGRYSPAVLGLCGTGYGLMAVVRERGLGRIARWLPFTIGQKELLHWLLNKVLRPHVVPSSREDVLIEQAMAREALAMVLEVLRDECPDLQYDMVVAGGGVLAHTAHPGLAALTLLDALQPTVEESTLALDMHLDVLGLLSASGALATLDTDAAVSVADRDLLRNKPLATCVVALGEGKPGEVAVEAELTTRRGNAQRISVCHGQIARLPLNQGMKGQLVLRPASGVRIGRNAPGVEVSSDVAAVAGSALGVVIDARGRPLHLPTNDTTRRRQVWEWLVALGVERGRNPYMDSAVELTPPAPAPAAGPLARNGKRRVAPVSTSPPPPPPVAAESLPEPVGAAEVSEQPVRGKRISLEDLANEVSLTPPAAPQDSLQSDLDKLRQTVEQQPEKRGLFGRKKK